MRMKVFNQAAMIKIKAMAASGFRSAQIAHEIGSTPGSVRVTCCKMKIKLRGTRGSRRPPTQKVISEVLESTFLELRRHSNQKEITVQTLVSQLLDIVAKDDLFDAILDERSAEMG